MGMLQSLGINSTALIQFVIFVFTITYLAVFVFKPFSEAQEERSVRTKGGEDLAQEYHKKTIELHSEYEVLAREVHSKISEIYAKARATANAEYEKLVGEARAEANKKIEENRAKIAKTVASVSEELNAQTPGVALMITQKLLGK